MISVAVSTSLRSNHLPMKITLAGEEVYIGTGGQPFNASLPAAVFIHGAGCDHTVWILYARFLARQGFNALAVDLPGHGRSGGEPLRTVSAMSEWLRQLFASLGIGRAIVIGHSLGALVTLEFAANYPDLVAAAVMIGVITPMPVGEPLLEAARERSDKAVDMIVQFGHAYASQLGGNPVAGINIVNSNRRLLQKGLRRNLFEDLNACNDYRDGLSAATRVRCPVTLMLGMEDRMSPPKAAAELIAALGDPRVERIRDCGHMLMAEQPEAVHQSLVAAIANAR